MKKRIKARLVCIEPTLKPIGQRYNSSELINRYAQQMKTSDPPPILGVKRSKGRLFLLDGNHRYRAARKAGRAIRAWIVPVKAFRALLKERFKGKVPCYFGDLDPYILCGDKAYRRPA